jgi:hypothetical protein
MTVNLRGYSGYQAMTAGIGPRPARDYAPRAASGLRCADYSETGAGVKARQSSKIKELGDALIAIGCLSLDHQAEALGLARSTTWTILKANHKGSGLSAIVINRMLATPQLPPLVRAIILEYIDEKKSRSVWTQQNSAAPICCSTGRRKRRFCSPKIGGISRDETTVPTCSSGTLDAE